MATNNQISMIAGLMCGLSCLAGFLCGVTTQNHQWQQDCVKRGVAEYDNGTGAWHWKGFTNDDANFNEVMDRVR